MSSTPTEPSSRPTRRRGSDFSDRQIAQSVKEGLRVTCNLSTAEHVSGWIFGGDDFHWGVIDNEGRKHIVHKSAPRIIVEPDFPLGEHSSEVRTMIEPVVGPFRDFVMRTHFSQTTPVPTA